MTAPSSYFLSVLQGKNIVYMPTCLVLERMTSLYSHVAKIQTQVDVSRQLKGLLFLLRYFAHEVTAVRTAYEECRIRFFVGDWKQDRLRARRLLVNLQARLASIADLVGPDSRRDLLDLNTKLGTAWDGMCCLLDDRAGPTMIQDSCSRCRYFRSTNTACWQQVMGKALMTMDGLDECRDKDSYLILLCYNRIRTQLLREIRRLEQKYNVVGRFPVDKVLCISDEDTAISCPSCMTMVDDLNKEKHMDTRRATKVYTSRQTGHRQPRRPTGTHYDIPRAGMLASGLASSFSHNR